MSDRIGKSVLRLTENWKFYLGDLPNAWYKGFDDGGFKTVTLPHDWAVEQPFSPLCSSGTGYLPGGVGWYRLHFKLPEELRGKTLTLHFDGVYKNAQVWFNSYNLGKHPYGYTGFSFDVSRTAFFGGEDNVVSVKVTHTDIADSRWYTGSGIYRKVTLTAEEPLRPAEEGIYLITNKADAENAVITVRHEAVNGCAAEKTFKIVTELYGGDKLAARSENTLTLGAGGQKTVDIGLSVMKPRLWSVESPYLYTMKTYYEADGARYLADEQRVGIRTFAFDADAGFTLNGEPMKLKGVCVHHDAGCLGAAVTPEVWRRRLEALRGCGCNAIRCSHNPHMPELYDLCDEMGFLVMDEAFDEWENAKNKWSTGHNVYPPKHQGYFEDFPEWHERDLRSMVRRDRVHPSVIMWSLGNEIDYPNDPYCHPMFYEMTGNNDANKPAAERQYDPNKPNMERLVEIAKELAGIVRDEDTSRPVTMALAFPELSAKLGVLDALDVVGYNYKEHLYEADHAAYPDKPLLGSENGHHDKAWQAVADNDYISGQFLWTGIDYLGEARGWPVHGSGAGVLDVAGFPKDNYYRRRALWLGGNGDAPEVSDKPAAALDVKTWRDGGDGAENTGYLYQLELTLTDAGGIRTSDDRKVTVTVGGAGELAGIENGNLRDNTPYSDKSRRTHRGRAVVYVRRLGEGAIETSIAADGLNAAVLTLG